MRDKTYDKTHSCKGSLDAGISIRHETRTHHMTARWDATKNDYSWGENLGGVYDIHYCPWCGEKLEEKEASK